MPTKIRVLIVDDSSTMRRLLKTAMNKMSQVEVIGDTGDPQQVSTLLEQLRPDVMTLDINMPDMPGNELLKKIFPQQYVPTIVVSALGLNEGSAVIDALEHGAVDFIQKPSMDAFDIFSKDLHEKIQIASTQKRRQSLGKKRESQKRVHPKRGPVSLASSSNRLIVIGASTGGTEAIKDVLMALPADIPPILIVQHIPAYFSRAFADRLNELCSLSVREAQDGDRLEPGLALVAPGGLQMELADDPLDWRVRVREGEKVSGHSPSVDALFTSLKAVEGKRIISILLTGMGRDGAAGLKLLKDRGSLTIAQDKESCVVYGMPRAAVEMGAATQILPLEQIASYVMEQLGKSPEGGDSPAVNRSFPRKTA